MNVCFRWKRHRWPFKIVRRQQRTLFRKTRVISFSIDRLMQGEKNNERRWYSNDGFTNTRQTIQTDTGCTCRVRRKVSKVRVGTGTDRFARGFSKSCKTIDRLIKANSAVGGGVTNDKQKSERRNRSAYVLWQAQRKIRNKNLSMNIALAYTKSNYDRVGRHETLWLIWVENVPRRRWFWIPRLIALLYWSFT